MLLLRTTVVYFGIYILSTHIRRQNTIQHCMLHILPEVAWPKYSTMVYSIQVTVTYIIYVFVASIKTLDVHRTGNSYDQGLQTYVRDANQFCGLQRNLELSLVLHSAQASLLFANEFSIKFDLSRAAAHTHITPQHT